MGIGRRLLKKIARGAMTRVLDRVGGKVVSGMADTSSDAPSSVFEPKRRLYEELQKEESGRS